MTEENPSEPLNVILIFFGLLVIYVLVSKPLIEAISIFVYFFSKANSQYLSEKISETITVSYGTPGNVKVTIVKPEGYNYNAYFNKKMVLIESYESQKPSVISREDIRKFNNISYSSSAVEFESQNFFDFNIITIEKADSIKLTNFGGLNEK